MESSEPNDLTIKFRTIAKRWLEHFEKIVRKKKYDVLPSLFHKSVVWMGLESNICVSLEQTTEREFRELWPKQLAFTCHFDKAAIFPDASSVTILIPWTAQGLIVGSKPKEGRATIVLGIFDEDKILCINGHFSQNPITRITK